MIYVYVYIIIIISKYVCHVSIHTRSSPQLPYQDIAPMLPPDQPPQPAAVVPGVPDRAQGCERD